MTATSDELPLAVIFGTTDYPLFASSPDYRCIHVPLTAELSLPSQKIDRNYFYPQDLLTLHEYSMMQDELNEKWNTEKLREPYSQVAHFEYEFTPPMANLLLWRWLIRESIRVLQPALLVIPRIQYPVKAAISTEQQLYAWMLNKVLSEETVGATRVVQISLPLAAAQKNLSGGQQLKSLLSRIIHRKPLLERMRNSMYSRIDAFLTSRDAKNELSRCKSFCRRLFLHKNGISVLVVTQHGKADEILALSNSSYRMRYMSYNEFEYLLTTRLPNQSNVLELSPDTSSEVGVQLYFQHHVNSMLVKHDRFLDFISQKWRILITDAQHHPVLRQILDDLIKAQKVVAFVPEGATAFVGGLEQFSESAFISQNKDVTRFVLNEDVRDLWMSRGVKPTNVMVSGFLGNTLSTNLLARTIDTQYLRYLIWQTGDYGNSNRVFLDFSAFLGQGEVGSFGWLTHSERLRQLINLTECLLDGGYFVIAKTRDDNIRRIIEERFEGQSLVITFLIPWQSLVDASRVTITRDSSLGWESLVRGKPVLIWNFTKTYSFTEMSLRGYPFEWVRIARTPSSVLTELSSLIKTETNGNKLTKKRERPQAPVSIRRDQFVHWISQC